MKNFVIIISVFIDLSIYYINITNIILTLNTGVALGVALLLPPG